MGLFGDEQEEFYVSIAIVGMLDEREGALRTVRDQIRARGHKPLLIDISIGTGAIIPALVADVSCGEIAGLAGTTIENVREMVARKRDRATFLMADGLKRKILELHRAGGLEGIIAVTGTTGAIMALTAMKSLPFGVPKLLVSSALTMPANAATFAEYLSVSDITVMHSVVDTVGMNGFVRTIALNAANSVSGMVEGAELSTEGNRPSVAITEFGLCDIGAYHIREMLEQEYEVVSFHATGFGDRAAVELVRQGYFEAFIDLVPSGFSEYLLGGNRAFGQHRLEAAIDRPIPYIFCPGGFDLLSCGPIGRKDNGDSLWVSRRLAERKYLMLDAVRVQARTSPEEMEQTAAAAAEKLNRHKYKSRVKCVIPLRGFSSLGVEDGVLYDPSSDETFIATLKKHLDPLIRVIEVDADINSREFARAAVNALSDALEGA